ncbi:MAG: GNAT family N-acetyltransferase [Prevotellaceae bacterium]|jgi:ribosomal protein S18 acetylase RimI-like enzyme|nr:GNAT family N-acetyltransferase [Prevotellaceae bacterium]
MELQLAKIEDLNIIEKIFKNVIQNLTDNNIFQWDEIYPNATILEIDILKNQLYKIIFENNIISAFVLNKEFDKEYGNGKWNYCGENFIILHRLCVDTAYQNKGYGEKTMLLIEDYLKNNGIQAIRLDVFPQNNYAMKLYNKLGYRKTGEAHWRKGLFYLFEKIIY